MIYVFALNPAIDYHMSLNELVFGETNRSISESYRIGGKGINVALVLNNLGTESDVLGYEGGFTGAYIKSELARYPHITDRMIHIDGDSRINVKLKQSVETEINALGPSITEVNLKSLHKLIDSFIQDDIVVLNGSLGKDMPSDWYLQLARILNERGIQYVLDIASPIVKDICSHHPLLLKPNHDELEIIFGASIEGMDSLIEHGQKLIELGAQNVIVSMGAEGSLLITKDKVYQASNPPGKLVDTVGAGDSMIAGFLYEFTQGKPIEDCYKTAIAAGSGTAYSEGLTNKEMIMTLLSHITLREKGASNEN